MNAEKKILDRTKKIQKNMTVKKNDITREKDVGGN